MNVEKLIGKISIYFTNTGFVPLSPLSSLMGLLYIFMIGKIRIIYKIEFYILLFLSYVFLSTLFYEASSFFDFQYYRYDGNIWISYLPIFFFSFSPILIRINDLIKFIKISFLLYFTYAIFWYITTGFHLTFAGFYDARNATGGFLSILTIASFILSQYKIKYFKLITFMLFIILCSTYSRGSILSFLIVLLIISIFYKRKILLDVSIFLLVFLLTTAVAVYFYNANNNYFDEKDISAEYITNSTNTKEANFLTRAVFLWPKAIDIFAHNPFLGSGFTSYNDYIKNGHRQTYNPAHAHNSYFHILAEMGLLGLTFYLFILFQIRKFWKKHRLENKVLADVAYFSLLTVIFAAFTEHRLTTPSSMILVSIFLGIFIGNSRNLKKTLEEKLIEKSINS